MKIMSAPSHLSGSAVVYVLAALIATVAAWAYWTPIDISVQARGIVRPEGDPIRVVSETGGRIRTIHVKEGSRVRLGDPLLQLETRDLELKKTALETRIHFTEIRLADLRQQLDDAIAIEVQSRSVDELERDSAERNARSALENARLRFTRAQVLLKEGLLARQAYDDARIALVQAEAEESRLSEKSLDLKRSQAEAHLHDLIAGSTPIRSELADLYHDLEQCRLDIDRLTIISPVDGQITSLVPLHDGEIISPATAIGTIVPEMRSLIIESWVPTSDRVFITPGQPVRLQAETFPPDQYDAIDGTVLSISPDARFNESLTGTFRVLVRPALNSPELHMGMTFLVHFITRQERMLWLLFQKVKRSFE